MDVICVFCFFDFEFYGEWTTFIPLFPQHSAAENYSLDVSWGTMPTLFSVKHLFIFKLTIQVSLLSWNQCV